MGPERGHRVNRTLGFAVVLTAALLAVGQVCAEVLAPRGSVDTRIREVAYDAGQIYRLRAFAGYQIDLEFETGESFVGLSAGDLDGVTFASQENHLFLKPKAVAVATNITVLTDRRHYRFVYETAAHRPTALDTDVIFALRFIYPELSAGTSAALDAHRIDSGLAAAAAARPQNEDYWYCGNPALRPVFAADDGVHTRLRFAPNSDLPAMFAEGEDGGESLLNYSMEGGDLIIHRVARRFVVRRGRITGCIVNKGFAGGGVRLDTGTVAPDIERRVQGVVP